MLVVRRKITVEDLIIVYLSEKLKNGYETYVTEKELNSFLDFFNRNKNVNNFVNDVDYIFDKINKKYKDKTIDKEIHLILDDKKVVYPTYMFSAHDVSLTEINSLSESEINEIKKIIKMFLSNLNKRNITISETINNENMKCGYEFGALLFQLIWNCYTEKYLNDGLWPKQCLDIQKYLLDIDLGLVINLPSIKTDLLKFYKIFSLRLASLIEQNENLKLSSSPKNLLAYSNYLICTSGFEKLVSLIANKTFSLSIGNSNSEYTINNDYTFIRNNLISDDDIKKLVYTLNIF